MRLSTEEFTGMLLLRIVTHIFVILYCGFEEVEADDPYLYETFGKPFLLL